MQRRSSAAWAASRWRADGLVRRHRARRLALLAIVRGEAVAPGPVECLVASPSSIAFDDSCANASRELELGNRCEVPIEIESFAANAPFFVEGLPSLPARLEPGATMRVSIGHAGSGQPPRADALSIRVTGDDSPLQVPIAAIDGRTIAEHADALVLPMDAYDHLIENPDARIVFYSASMVFHITYRCWTDVLPGSRTEVRYPAWTCPR